MNLTLARTITCTEWSCLVQRLDDGTVYDAPLAPQMVAAGIRIRPGMIVALDGDTAAPTIRFRFETRPVEALAGDRLTILGRAHPFTDARPPAERAVPLRVGDTVTIRFRRDADGGLTDTIDVLDTLRDGRPRHPELLEAEFPRIAALYAAPSAP